MRLELAGTRLIPEPGKNYAIYHTGVTSGLLNISGLRTEGDEDKITMEFRVNTSRGRVTTAIDIGREDIAVEGMSLGEARMILSKLLTRDYSDKTLKHKVLYVLGGETKKGPVFKRDNDLFIQGEHNPLITDSDGR